MSNRYAQNQTVLDVYSDIDANSGRNNLQQDATEFSLSTIQQKLGVNAEQAQTEVANATPDVMPSNQTLSMNYARNYAPDQSSNTKASSKTKAIVISYVAVVLVLVLAVTLCGVSVSGAFNQAIAIDAEYTDMTSQVANLTEIAGQEDFEELLNKAQQLGYVDSSASNTLTYTEVETRPAQNIAIQTNWFDSLCDWVSEVFGA